MQALTITLEASPDIPNVHIAHFEGAFDGGVREPIEELDTFITGTSEATKVIFDFTNLSYLNSYAIGQLVSWQNHLAKDGGEILLAAPSKNVEDIFNILGIGNLFKVFPKLDDALSALKGAA